MGDPAEENDPPPESLRLLPNRAGIVNSKFLHASQALRRVCINLKQNRLERIGWYPCEGSGGRQTSRSGPQTEHQLRSRILTMLGNGTAVVPVLGLGSISIFGNDEWASNPDMPTTWLRRMTMGAYA